MDGWMDGSGGWMDEVDTKWWNLVYVDESHVDGCEDHDLEMITRC
jgi:hypothetical protein